MSDQGNASLLAVVQLSTSVLSLESARQQNDSDPVSFAFSVLDGELAEVARNSIDFPHASASVNRINTPSPAVTRTYGAAIAVVPEFWYVTVPVRSEDPADAAPIDAEQVNSAHADNDTQSSVPANTNNLLPSATTCFALMPFLHNY